MDFGKYLPLPTVLMLLLLFGLFIGVVVVVIVLLASEMLCEIASIRYFMTTVIKTVLRVLEKKKKEKFIST